MNMTNKSKFMKGIIVLLLCCILLSLMGCNDKAHSIEIKNTLTEFGCQEMQFSEEEKNTVDAWLKSCYYEDSEECGFVFSDENSVDLYKAVNLLQMAVLLNNDTLINVLRQELAFLSDVSVDNYGILNLIYYVQICDILGLSYNSNTVKDVLMRYYDTKSGMFFVFGENDAYGIKHTISKMCVEKCGNLIVDVKSEMQRYARQTLDSFPFTTDSSITLYNAGGSILTYCESLGVDCSQKLKELDGWMQYWEHLYESCDTTSINGALSFAEYLLVKNMFQPAFPSEKLQKFYQNLTEKDIEDTADIQMLYNIIKYVEPLNNAEKNQWLNKRIQDTEQEGLFSKYISSRNTAYALALASWTGFSYDHEKINNYVKNQYEAIPKIESIAERANALYYVIAIDQIANNYTDCIYEEDKVQEEIDAILNQLSGKKENAASEMETVVRIVEIASDLQVFQKNIIIKEKYISKIESIINNVVDDSQLAHSILVVDAKWVNDCLDFSLVDETVVSNAYAALKTEKGVKPIDSEDTEPDVYSTFRFLKLAETDLWSEPAASFSAYTATQSMESLKAKMSSGEESTISEIYYICYLNCVDHSNTAK